MAPRAFDVWGERSSVPIRQLVESHAFVQGLRVAVSAGLAERSGGAESLDSLLSRADDALYRAKHEGRNRVESAPSQAGVRPSAARTELRWHRQYECGDPDIDAEHKRLFEDATAVLRLVSGPNASSTAVESSLAGELRAPVLEAIDRLLAHTQKHFETEEAKLAALGWSGLEAHRAEHGHLMSRALQLRSRLAAPEPPDANSKTAAPSELISFLFVELVANHILRSDRQYASVIASSLALSPSR